MDNRTISETVNSLGKLFSTNRLDWESVLAIAPFKIEFEKGAAAFAKANNAIVYKYMRQEEKNKKDDVEAQTDILPNGMPHKNYLTAQEVEAKSLEIEEMMNKPVEMSVDAPKLDSKVFKPLYIPEKPVKVKKGKEGEKEEEPIKDADSRGVEIKFTAQDITNYYRIGLIKVDDK